MIHHTGIQFKFIVGKLKFMLTDIHVDVNIANMKYIHPQNIEKGVVSVADVVRQYTIKELRARKNVTQEKVAEAVGVSPQTYCSWERGDISAVAISKVLALAEYFGVELSEIQIFRSNT